MTAAQAAREELARLIAKGEGSICDDFETCASNKWGCDCRDIADAILAAGYSKPMDTAGGEPVVMPEQCAEHNAIVQVYRARVAAYEAMVTAYSEQAALVNGLQQQLQDAEADHIRQHHVACDRWEILWWIAKEAGEMADGAPDASPAARLLTVIEEKAKEGLKDEPKDGRSPMGRTEALREENLELDAALEKSIDVIEELTNSLRKLEGALMTYGRHDSTCEKWAEDGIDIDHMKKCTCGFGAALAASEE